MRPGWALRTRLPRGVRRAARRGLSAEFGPEPARDLIARTDSAYPVIAARIPKTGPGARNLLRTGAYAIALHQTLVEHGLDPPAANGLISDIVFASILPARSVLNRIAGLRHREPLRRAMWGSQVTRRLYYTEPDWVMQDVPVATGFGLDVTRCVIAEFFESLDMSELCQRAICDQDLRSAAHHGVVLERSGTLAGGAERCDFRYRAAREERDERNSAAAPVC